MTDRRAITSAQNGKLGKGKKTKAGLEASSRNAQKHGIYAKKSPLADSDDHDLFQRIKEGLKLEFQPKFVTEQIAVEHLAIAYIRLNRLYIAQAAMIELQHLYQQRAEIQSQLREELNENSFEGLLYKEKTPTPEQKQQLDEIEANIKELKIHESGVVNDDAKNARFLKEENHLTRIIESNLKKLQKSKERHNIVMQQQMRQKTALNAIGRNEANLLKQLEKLMSSEGK